MSEEILKSILKKEENKAAFEVLVRQLSLSELNSFLMEVFKARAAEINPAVLLKSYQENRFVKPSQVYPLELLPMEQALLQKAAEAGFQALELSPVCPLGSCSVVATASQNKIISALRNTEVVADATNVLALESSLRRRKMGFKSETLHLCAIHRHIRTQVFNFEHFTPHFKIFCLTSAGKDTGHYEFEKQSLHLHLSFYYHYLSEFVPQTSISLQLYSFLDKKERYSPFPIFLETLQNQLPALKISTKEINQEQANYYNILQFKFFINLNGTDYDIADGGLTDWAQQLSGNRKERFLSSGLGLELLYKLIRNV